MSKYHFGQFSDEHLILIQEGIRLYNTGHYWLCHEELEDHWLNATGDNARYVYWFVIQIAAALYHWEDDNILGARGMINKAKRKIDFIESNHVESDLMEKYLDWSKLKPIVKSIPKEASLADFKELKEFKFQSPDEWKI